jgi:pyruvate,water dikinase
MVAHLFDERDESVERMVTLAIEAAHRAGKKIGICGQAPSDYPEFAEFLVHKGISSISLNPDTVVQTTHKILEVETALAEKSRSKPMITTTVIDSEIVQTIEGPEQ